MTVTSNAATAATTASETTIAEIGHESVGERIADVSPELRTIVETASRDDLATVEYVSSSGLSVELHGRVTEAHNRSGDLRLSTNKGTAYLHVNPETGHYYFQDHFRKSPADGFQISTVTLRHVGSEEAER